MKKKYEIYECPNITCYYAKLYQMKDLDKPSKCPKCNNFLDVEVVSEEEAYQKGFIQFANRPISGRRIKPPPPPNFSIKSNKK